MIRVVLHEPQELMNIALVVRAMKNFGFADLWLVSPREYDAYRIEGIAHRSADVLERARIVDRLADALADCVHVVAFSARGRSERRNALRPRAAMAEVLERSAAGSVALLFGREDTGLPNDALDLCHRVVTIPTDPGYPSLNLAHAVLLSLYELALARGDEDRPLKLPRRQAGEADVEALEQMFADVEKALEAMSFFKTRDRERILRTLRGVAHRTPLDEREARLLRAMAIEVVKFIGRQKT